VANALVFPRYVADAPTRVASLSPVVGVTRVIKNSFNYLFTAEAGFDALCQLVRRADCYELTYSRLDEAVDRLDALLAASGGLAQAATGHAELA